MKLKKVPEMQVRKICLIYKTIFLESKTVEVTRRINQIYH